MTMAYATARPGGFLHHLQHAKHIVYDSHGAPEGSSYWGTEMAAPASPNQGSEEDYYYQHNIPVHSATQQYASSMDSQHGHQLQTLHGNGTHAPPVHPPSTSTHDYYTPPVYNESTQGSQGQPVMRVIRRRNTANKKERRRTQSINNAYSDLRDCIPNVPVDTKLSKIKTLRLAASYIAYLAGILESGDPSATGHGFRADLLTQAGGRRPSRRSPEQAGCADESPDSSKSKGRTGWPEHVWALELKQEQV